MFLSSVIPCRLERHSVNVTRSYCFIADGFMFICVWFYAPALTYFCCKICCDCEVDLILLHSVFYQLALISAANFLQAECRKSVYQSTDSSVTYLHIGPHPFILELLDCSWGKQHHIFHSCQLSHSANELINQPDWVVNGWLHFLAETKH